MTKPRWREYRPRTAAIAGSPPGAPADGMTRGQRLADRVAAVGGSWSFIAGFGLFLVLWTVLNTAILRARAFDPYPFIFLNLVLSMVAAVQAPIIMMSQNRQAAKDRIAAEQDYETNVRAEILVTQLRDEVNALRADLQWLTEPGRATGQLPQS